MKYLLCLKEAGCITVHTCYTYLTGVWLYISELGWQGEPFWALSFKTEINLSQSKNLPKTGNTAATYTGIPEFWLFCTNLPMPLSQSAENEPVT